jgi:hypothetical protein
MPVILRLDGLYISPAPFLWTRVLSFAPNEKRERPRRRGFFSWLLSRPPEDPGHAQESRECTSLCAYQMGCLAQQMSVGGFDASAGFRCACETDRHKRYADLGRR